MRFILYTRIAAGNLARFIGPLDGCPDILELEGSLLGFSVAKLPHVLTSHGNMFRPLQRNLGRL